MSTPFSCRVRRTVQSVFASDFDPNDVLPLVTARLVLPEEQKDVPRPSLLASFVVGGWEQERAHIQQQIDDMICATDITHEDKEKE